MSTHPFTSHKELKEFLGVRFHQDWIDDGTPEEIVAAYVARHDGSLCRTIAAQITAMLAEEPSEEELEAFCGDEAKSDIFPPGLGLPYSKWLKWLAGALCPPAPTGSKAKKTTPKKNPAVKSAAKTKTADVPVPKAKKKSATK